MTDFTSNGEYSKFRIYIKVRRNYFLYSNWEKYILFCLCICRKTENFLFSYSFMKKTTFLIPLIQCLSKEGFIYDRSISILFLVHVNNCIHFHFFLQEEWIEKSDLKNLYFHSWESFIIFTNSFPRLLAGTPKNRLHWLNTTK